MKTFLIRALCVVMLLVSLGLSQDVIPLPVTATPNAPQENYPEKEYFSKVWNTEVVSNVTKPTLTVFKPSAESKNGAAVVICPGGGFMALSITSEGTDVAKYLVAKGVTAFVLNTASHTLATTPRKSSSPCLGSIRNFRNCWTGPFPWRSPTD
jgi:hypothetical protein